jgi:hypothetical protein
MNFSGFRNVFPFSSPKSSMMMAKNLLIAFRHFLLLEPYMKVVVQPAGSLQKKVLKAIS